MKLEELKTIANSMKLEYGLLPRQILGVQKEAIFVPLSIFANRKLGCLESLVKYLHENDMKFSKIAKLLKRDTRTIWSSYNAALRKVPETFAEEGPMINVEIFAQRKDGVLKTLVIYCKNNLGMKNIQIARALNRDPRTISSVLR